MMNLLGSSEKQAAVAVNNAPASTLGRRSGPMGCVDDMQKTWREGQFKTLARRGGVLNVVLCIFLCIFMLSMNGLSSIPLIIIACLIGILELPYICTCLDVCKKIQPYMRMFEVYWIRGCFYIALGILTFAIFGLMGGFLCLVFGTTFVLDGLLYCLAHFRGETHSDADDKVDSLGLGSGNQLKAKVAATAMGIV